MKDVNFIIGVKPEVVFPKMPADIIKFELLEANIEKVSEYLENIPNEHFLSLFTFENRKLLAELLKGKIKKRRGLKQERGFDDFLLFMRYKQLRSEGCKKGKAIKITAEEVRTADKFSKEDLFRRASEGRYWKDENIEENIKMIVGKMEKYFSITENNK